MHRLTVLSVAYPLAPVGPDAVGGAEQVLARLDAALVGHGHRSIVVGMQGSVVRGELVATPRSREPLDEVAQRRARAAHAAAIDHVLSRTAVDVVHMHGVDFDTYLPAQEVPVLATLHLPLAWYSASALAPRRPRTFLCCVSALQRSTAPAQSAPLGEVSNGVDLDVFRPRGHARPFALCLARICPEKGIDLAVEAAKRAGLSLVLGGELFGYPEHVRYFEDVVRPMLDSKRRFCGPLSMRRKARLLAGAQAVIVASRAPETSSLVAMEALASGTPVVARPVGALAEIVRDGVTGFLASDVDGLAEGLRRSTYLSRRACRSEAETRFSARDMERKYLALYERIAGSARARSAHG